MLEAKVNCPDKRIRRLAWPRILMWASALLLASCFGSSIAPVPTVEGIGKSPLPTQPEIDKGANEVSGGGDILGATDYDPVSGKFIYGENGSALHIEKKVKDEEITITHNLVRGDLLCEDSSQSVEIPVCRYIQESMRLLGMSEEKIQEKQSQLLVIRPEDMDKLHPIAVGLVPMNSVKNNITQLADVMVISEEAVLPVVVNHELIHSLVSDGTKELAVDANTPLAILGAKNVDDDLSCVKVAPVKITTCVQLAEDIISCTYMRVAEIYSIFGSIFLTNQNIPSCADLNFQLSDLDEGCWGGFGGAMKALADNPKYMTRQENIYYRETARESIVNDPELTKEWLINLTQGDLKNATLSLFEIFDIDNLKPEEAVEILGRIEQAEYTYTVPNSKMDFEKRYLSGNIQDWCSKLDK